MRSIWLRSTAGAMMVAAMAAASARGQEPSDHRAHDARIDQAILKTINLGVQLYNSGDQYGCYRLYQGQIITLAAAAPHHAEIAAMADAGLAKADTQNSWALRATVLRETLDQARAVLSGRPKPLWDRLGGETAVKAVVHDFVGLAAIDPKVDFTRGGRFPIDAAGAAALEQHLVELISAVSGGPLKYTGRDMKSSHAGMRITNAQFDAIAGDLITVLKKYNVPQKEQDELVKAVAATRKEIVEVRGAAAMAGPAAPAPPAPSLPAASTSKSLYTRLGGEAAIVAVVDDFVARAATDPKVNFTRKGTAVEWQPTPENVAHLKNGLVQLISQTTGGPDKYEGRAMKPAHAGMGITNAEFNALAADLKTTLEKFKVPGKEQDELLTIIGSTRADIVEKP
jgi:hemoglobin